jgi:hypothetical protein
MELERTSSQYTKYRTDLGANQEIASLFEPDTLLSAQYFENFRSKTLLEPEKSLMLGVLDDAVNCFQENLLAQSGRGKKLFDEAEEWILDQARDCIFSFENICEVLGFNAEYLRHGLVRWKEKILSKENVTENYKVKVIPDEQKIYKVP